MVGPNLLDPYGRNETCWCGSRRKYKFCHGNHRPASAPGELLPPDPDDGMYLSPSTVIAKEAIDRLLPTGSVPITMPQGRPAPTSISFTSWDTALAAAAADTEDVMGVEELGGLRVQVLSALAGLPVNDDPVAESVAEGVYQLTAETIRTVSALVRARPRPAVLWNHELDVNQFLGRTILLADHVFYPDAVFEHLLRDPSNRDLKEAAAKQLKYESLLATGMVIPVPPGVALAAQGKAALEMTAEDLNVRELVDWVRTQLIVEGPTARSALFIRAIDDLVLEAPNFWLNARIDPSSFDDDTGRFSSRLLVPYEPTHDYGPWIKQVKDSAVGKLVQRTHERLVAADVFGAEYVSVSMFEARLLRRRNPTGDRMNPAQAAVWADIPTLTDLTAPDLSKLLRHEDAIEDLRLQVRASLATARSDRDTVDAITDLAQELEAASRKLQTTAATDRAWQAVIPGGLVTASAVVGGVTGGIPGVGAAAAAGLGALATLGPYLGSRLNRRRDAAYLFVAARRSRI